MKQRLDAIYEDGLLRPLKKLSFPEGRRVRVTLESEPEEEEDNPPKQSVKKQEADIIFSSEENRTSTPPYLKVREALKGCPGEISEDIGRDREDRI